MPTPPISDDGPTRGLAYHPALDGVRALAVLAVLTFHGGVPGFGGGFLGVSTFFTLSGFLITSLLLAHLHDADPSPRAVLARFWSRRLRRLAPAAIFGVVLAAAVTLAVGTGDRRRALPGDSLAALADVANWRAVVSGQSYGARFSEPSALLHYWSLAVEEQFYLLIPLVVVVAMRWRAPRHRLIALAASIVALLALSVGSSLAQVGDADRLYYGTDARAAELLVGCLLAVVVAARGGVERVGRTSRGRTRLATVGVAALVLSVVAWTVVDEGARWLHPAGLLGYAAISAVLVAGCLVPGRHARALSVAPLVWLGRRSYGVYVVHWPLFILLDGTRTGLDAAPLVALRVGASVLLAAALYVTIEAPVRHQRTVAWLPRRRLRLGVGFAVAVLAVVTLVPTPDTVNLDFATVEAQFAHELARAPDQPPSGSPVGAAAEPATDAPAPWLVFVGDVQAAGSAYATLPVVGAGGLAHYGGSSVERSCSLLRAVPFRDAEGVHANRAACDDRATNWRAAADAAAADVVFVQIGLADLGDHQLDGRWAALGDPELDRRVAGELDAVITDLAREGRTIALATLPTDWSVLGPDRPWALGEDGHRLRAERFNQLVREAVAAHPTATVVDMDRWHRENGDGTRFRPGGAGIDPVLGEARTRFLVDELLAAHRATWAGRAPTTAAPDAGGPALRVLVVGDSTALPFAVGLNGRAGEHHDVEVASVARSNCGLARGGRRHEGADEIDVAQACSDWASTFADAVDRFRPDVVVVIDSLWELGDRIVPGDDRWRAIGDPVVDGYLRDEPVAAVDVLHAGGAPVVFVQYPRFDLTAFEEADHDREDIDEDVRLPRFNALLEEVVAERPGTAAVVDLAAHAETFPGGVLDPELRPDGVHFTERAARSIVDTWLLDQLRDAVARRPS